MSTHAGAMPIAAPAYTYALPKPLPRHQIPVKHCLTFPLWEGQEYAWMANGPLLRGSSR
ncbi:hypothetical protein OKW28_007352 [Paraburkholderia sp. 40]